MESGGYCNLESLVPPRSLYFRRLVTLACVAAAGFATSVAGQGPMAPATPPTMDWVAQEEESSHENADDRGQDIVFWVEEGDPDDDYWIYVTGWVTIMDGDTVVGKKFATYKYDAAHDGSGGPPDPDAEAIFPTTTISSGDNYKAYAIAIDPSNGDIYVAGEAPRAGNGQDYLVVKYNKNLVFQWSYYYDGPVSGDDIPADIIFDDSSGEDFVVVTGTSPGDGTGKDIATIALTPTGSAATTVWPSTGIRRYDGPDSGDDTAVELAAITFAEEEQTILSVVVLGTSWDDQTEEDFTTHVWSTDTDEEWEARYEEPGEDIARAMWISSDEPGGFVFITGSSESDPATASGKDYATIAYDTNGGDLLWTRRWDDSGDDDIPHDIHGASGPLSGQFQIWVTGDASSLDVGSVYYLYDAAVGPPGNPDFAEVWTSAAAWQCGEAVWVLGTEPYIAGAAGTIGSDRMLAIKYKTKASPPPLFEEDWHKTFYDDPDFGNEGRAIIAVTDLPGSDTNIYITGFSTEAGEGIQFTTWRYIE